jgi:hypothetical protein
MRFQWRAISHPATRKETSCPSQETNPPRASKCPLYRRASGATRTFDRRYADKDGTWKRSTSFGFDELLLLAKVADLAHTEIMKLRAADRAAVPQSEDVEAEAA